MTQEGPTYESRGGVGGTLLKLEYVRLSVALRMAWQRNPKQHDIGAIVESIKRYGFRDAVIYDARLNGGKGGFAAGNGRLEGLAWLAKEPGVELPAGVGQAENDGEWCVPVQFGLNAASQAAAEAFAIDHNNLVMSGGNFTGLDMVHLWDEQAYMELLMDLQRQAEQVVSVSPNELDDMWRVLVGMNVVKDVEHAGGEQAPILTRPQFADLVDRFTTGVGEQSKTDKNGNWLYAEYYLDDERWGTLSEALLAAGRLSRPPHELDKEWLYTVLMEALKRGA